MVSLVIPAVPAYPFYGNETEMAKATAAADETIDETMEDVNFSDTELRGISSFEDAMRLAAEKYGDVIDAADEIGSGFIMLDNKDKLVGEPFVILSFAFPEGDFLDEDGNPGHFAVVRLVTKHGDRFVVTDGSHGIYQQLEDFHIRSGRSGGLVVSGGLRKSEYKTEVNGVMQPAVTYYLNV